MWISHVCDLWNEIQQKKYNITTRFAYWILSLLWDSKLQVLEPSVMCSPAPRSLSSSTVPLLYSYPQLVVFPEKNTVTQLNLKWAKYRSCEMFGFYLMSSDTKVQTQTNPAWNIAVLTQTTLSLKTCGVCVSHTVVGVTPCTSRARHREQARRRWTVWLQWHLTTHNTRHPHRDVLRHDCTCLCMYCMIPDVMDHLLEPVLPHKAKLYFITRVHAAASRFFHLHCSSVQRIRNPHFVSRVCFTAALDLTCSMKQQ